MLDEDDGSEIPLTTGGGKLHYSAVATGVRNEYTPVDRASAVLHRSASEHSTLHDLAQPASDSPRFLDEMALDSETGGFFEQFLCDAASFSTSSERVQKQKQQSTPPHTSHPSPSLVRPQAQSSPRAATSSSRMPSAADTVLASATCVARGMENSSGRRVATPSAINDYTDSSSNSSSASSEWRMRYERIVDEVQALRRERHGLQENLKIVVRRAQEQAKLLSLQNSRIASHMEVHSHVLERVQGLETALRAANRQLQVERELRSAEVAQCEKVTLALHEVQSQIKVLNAQNSSASRELMHKEKLRVDNQLKTSAIKQSKARVELERDDAVIQATTMRYEKVRLAEVQRWDVASRAMAGSDALLLHAGREQEELRKLLDDCRREGLENLGMREEDTNAPKPRVFAEVGRASPSKAAKNRCVRRASSAGGSDTLRRGSRHTAFAVQPIDTSVGGASAFSTYGGRGSPRKQSAFGSFESSDSTTSDPETIERDDIGACIVTVG